MRDAHRAPRVRGLEVRPFGSVRAVTLREGRTARLGARRAHTARDPPAQTVVQRSFAQRLKTLADDVAVTRQVATLTSMASAKWLTLEILAGGPGRAHNRLRR